MVDTVKAEPYDWPYNGVIDPSKTGLLVIDMQHDFCSQGGYVDLMGYDISLTARGIDPIKAVLDTVRYIPSFTVIYTRQGHRPDLADLPANKRWRSRWIGAGIGDPGPCGRILVRGESGWDIVARLKAEPHNLIVDKPGKGSFYATDLDIILRTRGITHLVLTGITTDVCIHTTMREANDRGYECLLLADCTGATDEDNHRTAIKMVQMQGGVFGAVSTSQHFIDALRRLLPRCP
jgi:nicotinamidase-related amidase